MSSVEKAQCNYIDIFIYSHLSDLFWSGEQPCINHFHSSISKCPAKHEGPSIVSVKSWFCNKYSYSSLFISYYRRYGSDQPPYTSLPTFIISPSVALAFTALIIGYITFFVSSLNACLSKSSALATF